MIILDSSICISILNGYIDEKEFLSIFGKEKLFLTAPTIFELYRGIHLHKYGKKKYSKVKLSAEFHTMDQFISSFHHLNYNFDGAKIAAEIYEKLKCTGKVIDPHDCQIAGTMLAHGINRILTLNIKHFERITDLEIVTMELK